MIYGINLNPVPPATPEEFERTARKYSNEALRRENDALKAAALELCDALEQGKSGAMAKLVVYDGEQLLAAENRLRALVGLKPVPR